MKIYKIIGVVCSLFLLIGCQKKEAPITPPSQVLEEYLTAMKAQDGNAMARYTLSEKGDDFTISEEDAAAIGLRGELLQDFYSYVLTFTYEIDKEEIQLEEERASVDIILHTYDIMAVLNAGVEAHKEEFGKIKGEAGSVEEKSQRIAEILIQDFADAAQSYEASYTFTFVLVEDAWKLQDEELSSFYQLLLNTSLSE